MRIGNDTNGNSGSGVNLSGPAQLATPQINFETREIPINSNLSIVRSLDIIPQVKNSSCKLSYIHPLFNQEIRLNKKFLKSGMITLSINLNSIDSLGVLTNPNKLNKEEVSKLAERINEIQFDENQIKQFINFFSTYL